MSLVRQVAGMWPAGLDRAISCFGGKRAFHLRHEGLRAPGWIRTTEPKLLLYRQLHYLSATDAWGCPAGFEPAIVLRPGVTTRSLSHLGQGTSGPCRGRTCGLRGVGAALSRLS